MAHRWPYRTLVTATLIAPLLLASSPAAADPDASPSALAPAVVYARDVAACADATPLSDQDVWTLTSATGAVPSLDLLFRDPLGVAHRTTVPVTPGGTAQVRTPAGWSLGGIPAGYRLAACPATGVSTSVEADTPVGVGTPVREDPVAANQGAPTERSVDGPPAKDQGHDLIGAAPATPTTKPPAVAQRRNSPRLANTGQDIGAMVLLGLTLVLAGALLLIVRRRPKPVKPVEAAPEPLYWVTGELPIVEPRALPRRTTPPGREDA